MKILRKRDQVKIALGLAQINYILTNCDPDVQSDWARTVASVCQTNSELIGLLGGKTGVKTAIAYTEKMSFVQDSDGAK